MSSDAFKIGQSKLIGLSIQTMLEENQPGTKGSLEDLSKSFVFKDEVVNKGIEKCCKSQFKISDHVEESSEVEGMVEVF